MVKFSGLSITIIEKSYNPCKSVAERRPVIKRGNRFFDRKLDKAKKYPRSAEQRVCKKVEPTKRIKVIITVTFITSEKATWSIGENKYNTFSSAANPKADTTI